MAKSKKTAGGPKKATSISDKKPAKKTQPKLNEIKVKTISKKITEINNNFECLINECRVALTHLMTKSTSVTN